MLPNEMSGAHTGTPYAASAAVTLDLQMAWVLMLCQVVRIPRPGSEIIQVE
jgi:hypothetical protein